MQSDSSCDYFDGEVVDEDSQEDEEDIGDLRDRRPPGEHAGRVQGPGPLLASSPLGSRSAYRRPKNSDRLLFRDDDR